MIHLVNKTKNPNTKFINKIQLNSNQNQFFTTSFNKFKISIPLAFFFLINNFVSINTTQSQASIQNIRRRVQKYSDFTQTTAASNLGKYNF